MVSKLPIEFRKYIRNCYELRRVLTKTEQSLDEISYANLFPEENLKDTFLNNGFIEVLRKVLNRDPALLITGQDCNSKAALINILLGQTVLPPNGSNWRWIRLTHGRTKRLRLTFDFEYEIVEPLYGNEQGWSCVPEVDIRRTDPNEDGSSPADSISTTLEVEMPHPALRDGVQIYVCPDCPSNSLVDLLTKSLERITPITFYAIGSGSLCEENVTELRKLKETYPDSPILFVDTSDYHFSEPESTGTKWSGLEPSLVCSDHGPNGLRFQLESLGLINNVSDSMCRDKSDWKDSCFGQYTIGCLSSSCEITEKVASFVRTCLQFRLVRASAILSEVHNNCLRKFILSAFDMAREIQITPRKIQYARQREAELYESLMSIACKKQEEISRLIQVTLQDMKANISDIILEYRCESRAENTSRSCSRNVEMATAEIQQLVLRKLSTSVATELVRSVSCLQEYFIGTLQRCLESLERNYDDREENLLASDAVKQILNAAYNVDLKSSTSFSLVHTFLERLRKLIHGLQLPWTSSAQLRSDTNWRLQVATDMIDSLSSFRLARTISTQFQEKIRTSHECFENAMRSLESHYSGLLEQTEEQRVAIRKRHAPRLARLALDSTSMCDMVRWGVPACGKEIGRGQYGVVFACTEPWAGVDPCAVKSVVPPDERHWNDLAMEFYYTRSIPEHPRIVKLRGSIVDHSYGAGCSPAVLLVMERMTKDLYCGLKTGLVWQTRLQIAIDVVEGIRYLHSQGLVHRDIKLKNVLLDCEDRAKLTDLGFCIPEAMMSGSIVGTPIHMAPELLSGHYDSSVDVYAFGILFWYICAGQVRLPYVFEQFQNKEQLWNNVRKGIRPERLPHFDYSCWNLMERCWSGEPCQRPYLGDVQPQLESIMKAITTEPD